jgi:hypothetical protein
VQRRGNVPAVMVVGMDPDVDAAIETAASRTREAQERLIEKESESVAIVPEARVVERRAEDLHDLASTAADVEAADDGAVNTTRGDET